VVIPETVAGLSVTAIGKDAFLWDTNITSVILPNSVTSIGYDAFWAAPRLIDARLYAGPVDTNSRSAYGCVIPRNILTINPAEYLKTYVPDSKMASKSPTATKWPSS
jgi:hypothetical protein